MSTAVCAQRTHSHARSKAQAQWRPLNSAQYAMALDYLEFDYSEDEEGTGTWDAMASVKAERVPALAGEIEALLRWASQKFAGRQGALEDGNDWDYDLQAQDDDGQP
jgi:hypothetical protein